MAPSQEQKLGAHGSTRHTPKCYGHCVCCTAATMMTHRRTECTLLTRDTVHSRLAVCGGRTVSLSSLLMMMVVVVMLIMPQLRCLLTDEYSTHTDGTLISQKRYRAGSLKLTSDDSPLCVLLLTEVKGRWIQYCTVQTLSFGLGPVSMSPHHGVSISVPHPPVGRSK